MFDSLRKKLKKTIRDASDSIPEEELEPSQISQELDDLESDLQSIEDKYADTTEESKEETTSETEEPVEETTSKEEEDISEEPVEETSAKEEEDISEEPVEETAAKEEEDISEEPVEETVPENEEDTIEDVTEDIPEEKSEDAGKTKKKKGFFGFLKRDNKEEEHTFEVREDIKNETTVTEEVSKEIISEDKTESIEDKEESTEESTEETIETSTEETIEATEEKSKEEKKSRFGFLKRDKKQESTDDKDKQPKYEEEEDKGGAFSFITKKTIKEEDIEEILEELEFSLIEGDVAFDVAERIVESVKEDLIGRKIRRRGDMELFTTNALKKAITEIIDNGHYDLLGDIEASKQKGEPYKIMFVGINGTGKTTTIAKMAKYLEKHGYTSVFGASDTFRAGAIEQLEHHAKNLNLKIIKHERNSDPAAVAYDAVEHAKATGKDVVLIDTSGRMQTNTNLMDEMKKIKRVSKPDIVLYVGDALMGNDATEQASKFNEVIELDGIILTKADADAKGGAAISIGHVIHKPILFIGTGQSYDDLLEFEPEWMIQQIFEEE